jgi:putative restriction endonuclease
VASGSPWSRSELLAVLNLYLRTPFGRFHHRNPDVVAFAGLIGRSPNAVALKLSNFASLDPVLRSRGIRGMPNVSREDVATWRQYEADPEGVAFESEQELAALGASTLIPEVERELAAPPPGEERLGLVKLRVNQRQFRRMVLARYGGVCCVTGLDSPELLVAAHIVPWSHSVERRMDPRNALLLNGLHDRAFEIGAIIVEEDLRVRVSPRYRDRDSAAVQELLMKYDGRALQLHGEVEPDRDLLRIHRERFEA